MNLSISNYLSKITMKKITMLTMLLWMSISVMAQGEKRESKWTVTPRVGMTISDYAHDTENMYATRVGFGIGAEAEYRISPLVGVSGGVFYATQGAKVYANLLMGCTMQDQTTFYVFSTGKNIPAPTLEMLGMSEDDVLLYELEHDFIIVQKNLNIPILVNFHVWKGLTLKTGIQVEYLMGARLKGKGDGFYYPWELVPFNGYNNSEPNYRITGDKVYTSKDVDMGIKDQFRHVTLSIPIGISYEYKNIELDARYHFGLNNLLRSNKEEDKIRTSLFLLTLGYKFQL